jgi:hypothetical protein
MKRAISTALLVVCAAMPALSADLEFSGAGEAEYDDNVFRTSTHKDDDGLFRIYPGVRIYEDRGDDLNFSAGYTAPVEFSVEHSSEFRDVDHIGDGRFDYHANDRIQLFGSDHYGYIRSTLRTQRVNTDPLAIVENVPQFTDRRDQVKVNDGLLGGTYRFSPRTAATARLSTGFFDSTRHDRARVWSVGGMADLNHRLTLKHQIGAGGGYSFQEFDERTGIEGSQTQTYRVYGTWRWTITPKVTFDLNAGPAYLETKQDAASAVRLSYTFPFAILAAQNIDPNLGFVDNSGNPKSGPIGGGSVLVSSLSSCGSVDGIQVVSSCGGRVILDSSVPADAPAINQVLAQTTAVTNIDPSGQHDTEVTGFVDATLSQRWSPNLATALRYSRQQGDASGLGGTVIEDVVSLANTWDFAERWQFYVRGDYVRRESAFDLNQTYEEVGGQVLPGGTVPIAARTGTAFNSKRDVQIDSDTWRVAGRITHQLFKNTSIYGQVDYAEQQSHGSSLGAASDYENFLATFGVRHVFEPIPLW